jgi:hypothetical protein
MNKSRHLQSIVFSLVILTGTTAGTNAFAESDKSMMTEHLDDEYAKQDHNIDKKMYKTNVDTHKKEYLTAMTGGYERSLNITKDVNSYMVILNTEYQKISAELLSNDSLTAKEKYDIQRQFIEKAKAIQMAWTVP